MTENPKTFFARAALDAGVGGVAPRKIAKTLGADGAPTLVPVDHPIVSTMTLAQVIGVGVKTFADWQRKYRLFGWSPDQGRRGVVVMKSTYDCLSYGLVADMVEHGIHVVDAARLVGGVAGEQPESVAAIRALFASIIADPRAPSLIAFHKGGIKQFPNNPVTIHLLKADKPIGDTLRYVQRQRVDKLDGISLVDLRDIVARVQTRLGVDLVVSDATPVGGSGSLQ
jgi:hypothetical protein